MLIIVAIVLLIVLGSPWGLVAFIALGVLWIGELFAWHATVRKRRRVVGAQTLIGREAVVTTACRPVGQVRLDGETWEARCDEGAEVGDRVRIVGREQLTLAVEPVAGGEQAESRRAGGSPSAS